MEAAKIQRKLKGMQKDYNVGKGKKRRLLGEESKRGIEKKEKKRKRKRKGAGRESR